MSYAQPLRNNSASQSAQDLARFGRHALAEVFECLHSTVKSDRAVMSRMTSGWPQMFLDADEVAGQTPEAHRRRFSPSEIRRAEELCTRFSRMPGHSDEDKKLALDHATREAATWKSTAARSGRRWTECRSVCDGVMVAFAYVVAEYQGVGVGQPRAW